jgi:hypothetical protein
VTRARLRLLAARAAFLALGLAAAGVLAEIAFRLMKPMPPLQIAAQSDELDFWIQESTPLWRMRLRRGQANEDCPRRRPAAAGVEIFGPSIFWGSGLAPGQPSFSERLQAKLDAAAPGEFCVMNFAQPGFRFQQSAALARELIPRHRPRLVFWAIWASDTFPLTAIGRRAYDLQGIPVGDDGYPRAFPAPGPLNRVLFRHSRLYEYATLKVLQLRTPWPETSGFWRLIMKDEFPGLVREAERSGATLVPVFCPRLDRPFSDWMSAEDARQYVPEVEAAAEAWRLPVLRLGDALKDHDVTRLRADECCHFNDAGHEALADVFFRWIMTRRRQLIQSSP